MKLYVIPHDKANHWVYGTWITFISVFLALLSTLVLGSPVLVSLSSSIVPVVILAYWKERRDKVSGLGTPERADFLYTVGGGLSIYLPVLSVAYTLLKNYA